MFPAEPLRFALTSAIGAGALVLAFLVPWLFYPALAVAALALAALGWWYIVNRTNVIIIDDNLIAHRKGVFNKSHVEIHVGSIRTVRVDQTLVDRIFGCGLLRVISAGDSPNIMQDGLPDVRRLREALRASRAP